MTCLSMGFAQNTVPQDVQYKKRPTNAIAAIAQGKPDEAIKNLEKATTFNFRYIQAFANLASAYLMKGLIEDSIESSNKAIQLNADFAPAHNNLAIAYLEKGAYVQAAEHADKAVKLGYDMAPEILNEIDGHR